MARLDKHLRWLGWKRDLRRNSRGAVDPRYLISRPSPWEARHDPPGTPPIPVGTNDGLSQSGTFSSGATVQIPPNRMLVAFAKAGFTATLTGNYDNNTSVAMPAFRGVGDVQRFNGSVFNSVTPSAGDANIAWMLIPDAPLAPFDAGFAFALGNGVVFVPPGTNTIKNALTTYGVGTIFQLGVGTYNEAVASWPATVSQIQIQGVCPPDGITNTAIATIEAGQSVINVTSAPAANDVTIYTGVSFKWVTITGATPASSLGFIRSTSSASVMFNECQFVDLQCALVRGFGTNLIVARCRFLRSTTPPSSGCNQSIINPTSVLSVSNIYDFDNHDASTGHMYVGTYGSGSGKLQGPWYFLQDQYNPSQLFTQDVAIDCEMGGQAGLSELYVSECIVYNQKLAYLTNVGWAKFQKCKQMITPVYAQDLGQTGGNTPTGGVPMLIMPSTGATVTNGSIEVDGCEVIQRCNFLSTTLPNTNQSIQVFQISPDYVQRLYIHGGRYQVNSGSPAPSGNNQASFLRCLIPNGANAQFADHIQVEDVEFSFAAGQTQPTAINMISLGLAGTNSASQTVGTFRVNNFRLLGATGPSASSITVTSSPFAYTQATQPADIVLSNNGATITNVSLQSVQSGVPLFNIGAMTTPLTIHLEVGDVLTVTYSVATPTMTQTPHPAGGFCTSTGGDGVHNMVSNAVLLGTGGKTLTVTSEELGFLDFANMAASAVSARRTTAGTYTATNQIALDLQGTLQLRSSLAMVNGIATVGPVGVSSVYKSSAQTLNTNVAPTTQTYTPPATAGVYRITGQLNALTAGTMTWKIKVTYHDPGGNAVTDIPVFIQQNDTTLHAGGPAANTAGRYTMVLVIAIDNSGTAIVIQDNAGTYTAGTYYWNVEVEQLA